MVSAVPTTPPVKRPGYGQLLRTPGAWTFLLPGFAARQPCAMPTISIVLLLRHTTGSFGTAGAVAAVTGVSLALFALQSGKLAPSARQPRAAIRCGCPFAPTSVTPRWPRLTAASP